jgi:Amidohydrolase family
MPSESAGTAKSNQRLILTGVTVVDTRNGAKSPGRDILIENGKIAAVAQNNAGGATSAQIVEARGKFVVPGYLDMHCHPLGSRDDEGNLNMMLAYGITGVRQMSGSPDLLAARRTGALIPTAAAPELLIMPGMILMPLNAGSADTAKAEVNRQKEAGADFIKVVLVQPPVFFVALEEARRIGLPYAGHIPPGVNVVEAARAGMYAIEHLHGSFEACSTEEEALRKYEGGAPNLPPAPEGFRLTEIFERAISNPMLMRPPSFEFERRMIDTYSVDKAKRLGEQFAAIGTWQVATLIRRRTMQLGDDPQYRNDSNLRFMPQVTRQMWEGLARQFGARIGTAAKKTLADLSALQIALVRVFREGGVKMVAGSDMGGQWCIPGASLHQEFALLAEAGYSPLEVLQMTTLNGAKFLGREDRMGTVEPGKNADLAVLDADPLADIANLARLHGVLRAGAYYSADMLGALKRKTEQRHATAG